MSETIEVDEVAVIEKMQIMCEESCTPHQFEAWESLKLHLMSTRKKLCDIEKLDTCPFCGGSNLGISPVYDCGIPGERYRIRCDDCGACGPLAKTEKKAWKKFRKRTADVVVTMVAVFDSGNSVDACQCDGDVKPGETP